MLGKNNFGPKNSGYKKILVQKNVCTKKFFDTKLRGPKRFGSKTNFVFKTILSRKKLVKQIFWANKMLGAKNFWVNKNGGENNFGSKRAVY